MTNIYSLPSIIVQAQTPNLSAHSYTQIYGGSAGCSMTLNGVNITIGAGNNLNVSIRTISGGAGCFLLGQNKDVTQGSNRIQ